MFHKDLHHGMAKQIPNYIQQQNRTSTQAIRPTEIQKLSTIKQYVQIQFLPRIINDCNSLPTKRLNIDDAEASEEHLHILLQNTHTRNSIILICTCKSVFNHHHIEQLTLNLLKHCAFQLCRYMQHLVVINFKFYLKICIWISINIFTSRKCSVVQNIHFITILCIAHYCF